MRKVEERMSIILRKAVRSSSKSAKRFSHLDVFGNLMKSRFLSFNIRLITYTVLLMMLSYVLFSDDIKSTECLVEMPSDAPKVFREPENCDICINVSKVDKIANISGLEFFEKYARTARPLVVTDGALNWPALKSFDFNFFKDLYETVDFERSDEINCQFFPYKTDFKSLDEVFEMSAERAELAPGEKSWYVGWSNCNYDAGKILREYYENPYFLSTHAENIALSWIFMGGPGHGAHMHVDNVYYPSWQAQLNGRKVWRLAPPPECLYKCKELEVIVEPGEIIVVDTNRWYHQTFILPGEISVTIGSEFD